MKRILLKNQEVTIMILADKIINLRKKNGWSQEELAEKLNVSRQAVSKWEGAQSTPDLEKILMMSKIFGVTTDFLVKDEIEMEEISEDAENSEEKTKRKRNVLITAIAAYWLPSLAIFLCRLLSGLSAKQIAAHWIAAAVIFPVVLIIVMNMENNRK